MVATGEGTVQRLKIGKQQKRQRAFVFTDHERHHKWTIAKHAATRLQTVKSYQQPARGANKWHKQNNCRATCGQLARHWLTRSALHVQR